MTPLAASILGYVLGLATALFVGAILLLVRGGRHVRDADQRRADRLSADDRRVDQVSAKGRGW